MKMDLNKVKIIEKDIGRGCLSAKVQKLAKEMLDREMDCVELRLYPYISNICVNCNMIDLRRVNQEEVEILDKLMDEGHIVYSSEKLYTTKEFYKYIHEVLFETYVEKHLRVVTNEN